MIGIQVIITDHIFPGWKPNVDPLSRCIRSYAERKRQISASYQICNSKKQHWVANHCSSSKCKRWQMILQAQTFVFLLIVLMLIMPRNAKGLHQPHCGVIFLFNYRRISFRTLRVTYYSKIHRKCSVVSLEKKVVALGISGSMITSKFLHGV